MNFDESLKWVQESQGPKDQDISKSYSKYELDSKEGQSCLVIKSSLTLKSSALDAGTAKDSEWIW